MFKIYPFRTQSVIGLDIQADAARLIQLKKTRSGHQIKRMAIRSMPANAFAAGKIQQWEAISVMLAEWFEQLDIVHQPAAISLPINIVRIKRIPVLASTNETTIFAEINSHLQHEMPGLNESLCIDFSLLPRLDEDYKDVLFTATRATYLTTLVECVQMAGLNIKIVDVDLYALMRAINAANNTFAILQIKNKVTEFIVFNYQEIIFHRHWEVVEINQWMEQLQANLQLFYARPSKEKLEKIIICGADIYFQAVLNAINNIPAERSHLTIESDFMVAYGLAMRELPPW